MLDNKSLSANLLSIWNPRKMAPGQNKSLYPGKTFEVDESVEDVRQAFSFYSPPDVTGNTPALIDKFRGWADDETGISRMMDGSTAGARKTAFEMSKIAESGNKLIGGIVRNIRVRHGILF